MQQAQIEEMKKLVIFSKKLSDWHAKNLQHFIMIAFSNVKSAEIKYDLGLDGKPGFVYFYLTRKGKGKYSKNTSETKKRGDALKNWVTTLLWKDLEVKVINKTDGGAVYQEGEDAKP